MLRNGNSEKHSEAKCDITILVAVYNHEKYLKTAIDSVLAQEIECSYEVIIVDDYSTDSSREILKAMEPSLPSNYRIIYRDRNYGIVDNYYDAVERMNGRYFIILEADDYWTYPHKIQKQYEFLEENREYLAVSHLHETIDGEGNVEANNDAYEIGQTYEFEDFLQRKLPGQTATILCRNYIRDNSFGYKLELGNFMVMDQVNAFLLAVHGKTYQIKEVWSVYRHITTGGSSYSATVKKYTAGSNLHDLYRGCCLYVRKHHMDDELVIKMENFHIRRLYDHWAADRKDNPVTADELLTELQQIRDEKYRQKIIEEMKLHYESHSSFESDKDFSEFDTDIKAIAFYLPQFHTFPENDRWWGKGFTEWTNVKKAGPLFDDHYQPRIPSKDIGYYDLSEVSALRQQAALAKRHGIYGFGVYCYWFSGKQLMGKPIDLLLSNPDIDFPFFLIWANENWTRTWDELDQNVLIKQDYTDADPEQFILDIKKYIDDERYIRSDGKPIIGIYAPQSIPKVRDVINTWRETARGCGIGEIVIWTCIAECSAADLNITDVIDGEYEFPPRGKGDISSIDRPNQGLSYDYRELVEKERQFVPPSNALDVFRGCMLEWDNSARRPERYHCWHNYSPYLLYLWNRINIEYTRKHFAPEKRFIFINAWNEWGEGAYLEPDKYRGYANINAVSKAIFDLPFEEASDRKIESLLGVLKKTEEELSDLQKERDRLLKQNENLENSCADLQRRYDEAQFNYDTISNAFFWKVSGPLRRTLDIIKDVLRK